MRTGLTRIELVVAASMAAFVVALVLPRVQAARADAAREQCKNNLRIIGQGCLGYEKAKGGLPPRRTGFNDGNPYGGWGSQILPYIDEPELARKYNFKLDFFDPANKAVVETQVKAFKCPASAEKRTTPIQSQTSAKAENPDKDTPFKVEAGINDYIASNGSNAPRSGWGLNATEAADGMGGNARQAMIDNDPLPLSKITDGLSCTVLVVEQAGRPDLWRAGKKKEGDGAQFGMANNARGAWAGWGSIVISPGGVDGGPARGDFTDIAVNSNNQFGVYGFHEGGAHILLCDGSVRFVGKNLAPLTLVYLINRDDGHMISPTDY